MKFVSINLLVQPLVVIFSTHFQCYLFLFCRRFGPAVLSTKEQQDQRILYLKILEFEQETVSSLWTSLLTVTVVQLLWATNYQNGSKIGSWTNGNSLIIQPPPLGVLLRIFGGVVWFCSPNPDTISDQTMSFLIPVFFLF